MVCSDGMDLPGFGGRLRSGDNARRKCFMARQRRSYKPEHKSEVVKLVREGSKPLGHVCRELDLTETAVRPWLEKDGARAQERAGAGGYGRGVLQLSLIHISEPTRR